MCIRDSQGAIADYSKAIELDPKYFTAYQFRGTSKYYLNDYEGAIADYSKAIELDPQYKEAYYSRGFVNNERGYRNAALPDMEQAKRLGYANAQTKINEWNAEAARAIAAQKEREAERAGYSSGYSSGQSSSYSSSQSSSYSPPTRNIQQESINRSTNLNNTWRDINRIQSQMFK